MRRAIVLSILLPLAMATVGWAAVITDFQTFIVSPEEAWASAEAQTHFPVSSSDLINEGSPFLSSWEGIGYTPCPIESYGPLSALINGNAGGSTGFRDGLPTPEGVLDIDDGAWTFVVNLNTVIAPQGYDITRVDTFTGHIWGNRKSQAYTLLVRRVGETSFEAIGSFERSLFNWNGGSTVLTISDSEGVIASGVAAIRWDVYTAERHPDINPLHPIYEQGLLVVPPTEYESVYREFDVYGSPSSVAVDIDIKPGSYPNFINLKSKGVVPVAILSSDTLDAAFVDASTVAFAGAGVAIRGNGRNLMAHLEDVNDDGYPDLVCHFETEDLDPDAFDDGGATLTGKTFDGTLFEGWDEVIIKPQK